jgi:hypothetical protein
VVEDEVVVVRDADDAFVAVAVPRDLIGGVAAVRPDGHARDLADLRVVRGVDVAVRRDRHVDVRGAVRVDRDFRPSLRDAFEGHLPAGPVLQGELQGLEDRVVGLVRQIDARDVAEARDVEDHDVVAETVHRKAHEVDVARRVRARHDARELVRRPREAVRHLVCPPFAKAPFRHLREGALPVGGGQGGERVRVDRDEVVGALRIVLLLVVGGRRLRGATGKQERGRRDDKKESGPHWSASRAGAV